MITKHKCPIEQQLKNKIICYFSIVVVSFLFLQINFQEVKRFQKKNGFYVAMKQFKSWIFISADSALNFGFLMLGSVVSKIIVFSIINAIKKKLIFVVVIICLYATLLPHPKLLYCYIICYFYCYIIYFLYCCFC